MGLPTAVDGTAAWRSARDQWVVSTHRYFVEGYMRARSEPARSLELLRKVLEGWAHAVSVECDPSFAPYEGTRLRTEALGARLGAAKANLPSGLREVAELLKRQTDSFHHNTGEPRSVTPRIALGALHQCAELLVHLHREILREPMPVESARIVAELDGETSTAGPVAPTWVGTPLGQPGAGQPPVGSGAGRSRVVLGVAAGVVALGAIVSAAWWTLGSREPAAADVRLARTSDPAPPPGPRATDARPDPIEWVQAYQADLASGDVDRIARGMRFPMDRIFGKPNADEPFVRKAMKDWFEKPDALPTFFERCVALAPTPDRHPVRCDMRLGATGAPEAQCLVFDDAGKLRSRTVPERPEDCPPRGVPSE
jgi:hypothetical protein